MTRKRANKGENTARMKKSRVNETQEETIKKNFHNERISAKHNESNMDIVMRNFHCQVQGTFVQCDV